MENETFELELEGQKLTVEFTLDAASMGGIAILSHTDENSMVLETGQPFTWRGFYKSGFELLQDMYKCAQIVHFHTFSKMVSHDDHQLLVRVEDNAIVIRDAQHALKVGFRQSTRVNDDGSPVDATYFPFGVWDVTLDDLHAALRYTFHTASHFE